MLASEAKKLCPELVLADGEDLTPFRDVSKVLFNFLRSHSWNNKVERLGFDEVFMGEYSKPEEFIQFSKLFLDKLS